MTASRGQSTTIQAGLTFVALVFGLARIAHPQTAAHPMVRTDGFYYLTLQTSGDSLHRVVRFYQDGTGVGATVAGDPARKPAWLSRDDTTLVPGRWTMEGNELVFRLSSGFSESTWKGTLSAEGWRTGSVIYRFVPVPFPKETQTSRNRRPHFVGPGKSTRIFQYDDAGRQTGVHHQLEIEAQDADGDSLTITWKATSGSIVGAGPRVLWQGTGPGSVTVTLDDGKGGRTVSTIRLS